MCSHTVRVKCFSAVVLAILFVTRGLGEPISISTPLQLRQAFLNADSTIKDACLSQDVTLTDEVSFKVALADKQDTV
jgi:hypothetical protein